MQLSYTLKNEATNMQCRQIPQFFRMRILTETQFATNVYYERDFKEFSTFADIASLASKQGGSGTYEVQFLNVYPDHERLVFKTRMDMDKIRELIPAVIYKDLDK